MGIPLRAVVDSDPDDPRFRDHAWQENFVFDFLKQSYLITARRLNDAVAQADGLDAATHATVSAYTKRYLDALSPSNFALTNPEVLRETVGSNGKNLVKGLKNLLKDLEAADGRLQFGGIAATECRLGRDLACTPGKVVFENELLQLIHYAPSTAQQFKRPLLIVPPWTNKYYLLDLRKDNSLVKWATDQGFTTFIVSWANPDETLARKTFDDYLKDGALVAIKAVQQASGARKIHLAAYCLGGPLLMATLAYMAARRDYRAASATFLASTLDHSDGANPEIADAFGGQRAGDLIWSFVVDNYLLGKDAFPSDLLYWHADAMRLPEAMHAFYLEHFRRGDKLRQPGGLTLAGIAIDVAKVKVPCYFVSTVDDQIAPWQNGYRNTRLPGGPVRFVLGGSGHIAGIVNPPAQARHGYWTNDALPEQADAFLANATRHGGSWWTDWREWLRGQADGELLVDARQPGAAPLTVIENAPGRYAARPSQAAAD
jgi:polyhydroxyalkanoate synthase